MTLGTLQTGDQSPTYEQSPTQRPFPSAGDRLKFAFTGLDLGKGGSQHRISVMDTPVVWFQEDFEWCRGAGRNQG